MVAEGLPSGWALFLGNSMPIRDVDAYCSEYEYDEYDEYDDHDHVVYSATATRVPIGVPVAANRGASGIDGVLSTAVGFAQGQRRGVTLLVGDVSAQHDANGFLMLQEARGRPPVVVVLVNNGGGGIFSFLPVADAIPEEIFEDVFATPTRTSFGRLAAAYGVAHTLVTRLEDLEAALTDAWQSGEHAVVEVVTDRSQNVRVHREVQEVVKAALQEGLQEERGGVGAGARTGGAGDHHHHPVGADTVARRGNKKKEGEEEEPHEG